MHIRETIATRLHAESRRVGFDDKRLASTAGLHFSVVKEYLKGQREVSFDELLPICNALEINLLYLLSSSYVPSRVFYRDKSSASIKLVKALENSLHLIKDYLPKAKDSTISCPKWGFTERTLITAEAAQFAETVKKEYGLTIEDVYTTLNLPIVPARETDFEAFFFSAGDSYAVCCSAIDKANVRIHFSLAHELCHYLCDRHTDVDIDEKISFFANNIPKGKEREFFAVKFAQFFLIPLDTATRWAKRWPRIDTADIEAALQNGRCSREVAINALFDALWIVQDSKPNYKQIDYHLQNIPTSPAFGIQEFLKSQSDNLATTLSNHIEDFSDDVLETIHKQFII